MSVTVIPIINDKHGTVPKGEEQRLEELEIRGTLETIQTIVFLRSARILRRIPETQRDWLLRFPWERPPALASEKNSQRVK